MSKPTGGVWDELEWRGLVHQATDPELGDVLRRETLTAYIGFDPTADSLHVGNLLQLCTLRRLQEGGHRPVALAGGGTGMVGDPGGKSEERNLLSRDELAANLVAIRGQLERFLDFTGDRALMLDNGEWLWSLGLLEFLRDVGKHFTVNQMVAKESVRARFEGRDQGISYTEFSYMLLQAYDFLHLYDTVDCRLQLGGSDQWGNITMGVELIRKLRGGVAYGLTSPLVLKADGTKFGKTEAGTMWLDARRTSPYALYQFLVGTEDAVVGDYLRYLTWLSREEIAELDRATAEHPEQRQAQRALAGAVAALVHGEAEAERARRASEALFAGDLAALDEATLLEAFAEAPSSELSRAELDGEGVPLVDLLARTGLVASKSAARKAVTEGGAYVNDRRETNLDRRLGEADVLQGRYILLRRGRKSYHLVRLA